MNVIVIVGIVIFFLTIGKILHHTGEALVESDFPPSFPGVVSRTLHFLGAILYEVGLIFYKLAVVLGCAYILRELL